MPKSPSNSAGSGKTLTNLKLGKSSSSTTNDFGGDLAELLIFSRQLSSTEEQKVEGYLAHKWGVANTLDSNHTYKDVPPIFDNKPLIGNMSTATITTGQNVSIQIPATRNPTSWSATGLATGLSINNSGVISGTTTFIGDFNATVTATNTDGNDSKQISFTVTKGQRIIAWDQNFTNITYGDAPITLNATATGTGDLNYTSSDSQIIEINGTSAIIRGGGSVTLTANAAENSTAFAAIPVTKTISVAKAPLTITGQDLTLPVGTSIPDLNYTATGWKHNDASLGVAANPAAFSNLALWLDASDGSTLFANTTLSTPATSSVAGWKDKSGNNNHAIQSTSANQPTITSTGIQFDGSNDGFTLTNDISEANLNIFFVLQGYGFLYANNATERTLFHDAGSGRKLWARINGSEFFSQRTVSGYSDSTTQIHEFSLNSGTFTVRVNGVEAISQGSVSGNMKLDRIGLIWHRQHRCTYMDR
jgi:hypothetical protein